MKLRLAIAVGMLMVVLPTLFFTKILPEIASRNLASNEASVRSVMLSMGQEVRDLTAQADSKISAMEIRPVIWGLMDPFYMALKVELRGSVFHVVDRAVDELRVSPSIEGELIERLSQVKDKKQRQFLFYQDSEKKNHLVLFLQQGGFHYAFLGPTQYLQRLVDLQKGSFVDYLFIDSSARVLAHSKAEYVGTKAEEIPTYQFLKSSIGLTRSHFYENQGEKFWGGFEGLSEAGVYLLGLAKQRDMENGAGEALKRVVVLAIGLLFLGVGLVVIMVGPYEVNLKLAQQGFQSLQTRLRNIENEKANSQKISLTQQEKDSEKMDAYGRIATALAFEIRSPMTAILAYAHSLLNQTSDPRSMEWIENILTEVRRVRGVLDKMFVFGGVSDSERSLTKIEGVVLKVLKELEPTLKEKAVRVTKDFTSSQAISINVEGMERVLRNLILNSIEAMERMPNKELAIRVSDISEGVQIEVQDTGEGIEPDKKEQIFDPFFTTRPHQKHLGLGMTTAAAILREHRGTIEVESERGRGTSIRIQIPLEPLAKELQFKVETSEAERAVSAPSTASPSIPPPPPSLIKSKEGPKIEVPNLDLKPNQNKELSESGESMQQGAAENFFEGMLQDGQTSTDEVQGEMKEEDLSQLELTPALEAIGGGGKLLEDEKTPELDPVHVMSVNVDELLNFEEIEVKPSLVEAKKDIGETTFIETQDESDTFVTATVHAKNPAQFEVAPPQLDAVSFRKKPIDHPTEIRRPGKRL